VAHQTFVNFCPFIIAEYSKHYKNDRTKAKSVGFGIANNITGQHQTLTTKEVHKAEMALALNKIIQNIQAVSKEKMEAFMDFMMDMLKHLVGQSQPAMRAWEVIQATVLAVRNVPTASISIPRCPTTNSGISKQMSQAALRDTWYASGENEGMRGKTTLSTGNQGRLTWIK
jgi:hypothetical protein